MPAACYKRCDRMVATLIAALTLVPLHVCKRCGNEQATGHTRQAIHRMVSYAASRSGYKLSRGDANRALAIAQPESSLDPSAKNPKSRAFGMYQLLPKTWKSTGIGETECRWCQTEAFLRYVKQRYGSLEKAVRFRNHRGWY